MTCWTSSRLETSFGKPSARARRPTLPRPLAKSQAQRHVTHAGGEVRPQLLGALLRSARHRPLLDELPRELRRVVRVEERLRFFEPLLAVLVDVDVVVERTAELRRVAALLARHRRDAAPLPPELARGELVRHPAVGVSRDAAE